MNIEAEKQHSLPEKPSSSSVRLLQLDPIKDKKRGGKGEAHAHTFASIKKYPGMQRKKKNKKTGMCKNFNAMASNKSGSEKKQELECNGTVTFKKLRIHKAD